MDKLIIETERLRIRNLVLTDLLDFHSYRSDPEVARYQGFDVFTIEDAETFIKEQADRSFGNSDEWVQYGIENKASGKLIGDCAIRLGHDIRLGEIGITISPTEQKKGFAKETLLAILNFLFNLPGFHRVTETVDADNTASIRLLESIGFRQEGYFIENIFFKGKWGSEYQYAMLKGDWVRLYQQSLNS